MHLTKKILVVFPLDFARLDTGGLREKCEGLLEGAKKWNLPCEYAFQWKGDLLILSSLQELMSLKPSSDRRKLVDVWHQHYGFWRKLEVHCQEEAYSAFWIRMGIPTGAFKSFVASCKLPVYLDIPTFPFLAERKGISWLLAKLTQFNLNTVASHSKYVFSPTSSEIEILGRPSLSVGNGVNTDKVKVRQTYPDALPPYRLVGFAQWSRWHGVDRLILGIAVAQLQNQLQIHLSGSGEILENWKRLAQKHKVSLTISSPCFGLERDELISRAHAGIGTLATARRALKKDSSLKNMMYIAYGVPLMVTERAKGLTENKRILQVADGDEPLDAHQILDWLEQLRLDELPSRVEMREVAATYDWSNTYANLYQALLTELHK